MKRIIYSLIFILLVVAGCGTAPDIGAIVPPYIETGIDADSWVTVPAGEFPFGQHDHPTVIDYDYQIMVTDVTNEQYADFLNAALAEGAIQLGDVEVEAGQVVTTVNGISGYYPGEPFDEYEHEEQITEGDKLYMPLDEACLLYTSPSPRD